jgi:lysophospholipase L1-like esterase
MQQGSALMPVPMCVLTAALLACAASARDQETGDDRPRVGELKDGDRVVFLGDGFFEREHEFGCIETELTSLWPQRRITFRNLGRSGDTVWGDAWAAFDTAKEGFARRRDLALALEPTVVFVAFGMSESFAGETGLREFESGLHALLDSLGPTGARVVLLGPGRHFALGPPLPEPGPHNRSLDRYRQVIARAAEQRGLEYIDMRLMMSEEGAIDAKERARRFSTDGIHLTAEGYRMAADLIAAAMGQAGRREWEITVRDADRPSIERARGAAVSPDPGGWLRFEVRDAVLPVPPVPVDSRSSSPTRRLRVTGLGAGTHTLKIDGAEYASGNARDWARDHRIDRGLGIRDCPELRQAETLRQTIVEKNRLLYYRWRPENETYLYGFRKHEQGRNAAEVPLFDPLVAEKEAKIARLRMPVTHIYEIVRAEEAR